MKYARIHDLRIDDITGLSFNDIKSIVSRSDGSKHVVDNVRAYQIKGIESDPLTFRQLVELCSNESFSPVFVGDDSGLGLMCDIVNFRHTLRGKDGNLREFNLTTQNHYTRLLLDWSSETYDTDWDAVAFSDFSSPQLISEGSTGSLDGITWYAAVGSWSVYSGYIKVSTDNGTNLLYATNWHWLSNAIVQVDITPNTNGTIGLIFRSSSIYNDDNCYYFRINSTKLYCYLSKGGTLYNLKTFQTTVDNSTTYTFKVKMQGNRFDFYIDGEFLGTVYDDTFSAGYVGFLTADWDPHFTNFQVDLSKPLILGLPVGAKNPNATLFSATDVHCDNIVSDGASFLLSDPINPLEFEYGARALNSQNTISLLDLNNQKLVDKLIDGSGNNCYGTVRTAYGKIYKGNVLGELHAFFEGSRTASASFYGYTTNHESHALSITVEVLIRPRKGNDAGEVKIYENFSADGGLIFRGSPVGDEFHARVGFRDITGTQRNSSLTKICDLDEWVHVIITAFYDESESITYINMYVNGNIILEWTDSNKPKVFIPDTTVVMSASSSAYSSSTDMIDIAYARVDGYVCDDIKERYYDATKPRLLGGEVKIWDTMGEDGLWDYLEFYANFDEGEGTNVYDCSKYNRSVTENSWANGSWSDSSYNKWAKSCYHFDGGSDYFYATLGGEGLESHGWTVGFWGKMDVVSLSAEEIWYIYDLAVGGGFSFQRTNADVLRVIITGSTQSGIWNSEVDPVDFTNWNFYVVTWSGNISDDPKLYINGTEITLTNSQQLIGDVRDADRIYAGHIGGSNRYDGYMDDLFVFSKELSADRIRWLYEHMPNMVVEKDWTNPDTGNTLKGWRRVYHPQHTFIGSMIIDNGLIRVSQNYRNSWIYSSGYSQAIQLSVYSDGIWSEPMAQEYYYFGKHLDKSIDYNFPIILKDIKRYSVTIRHHIEDVDMPDEYYMDRELYITAGNPFLIIKVLKWKAPSDIRTELISKAGVITIGYDSPAVLPRYGCATLDEVNDATIQTDNTSILGNETEGLNLAFNRVQKFIWLFFDESSDDWKLWKPTSDGYGEIFNAIAIDRDADTPPHWWGVGLLPFDTSLLTCQQNSASDGDEWTLVGADAVSYVTASGGYAVRLNALGEMCKFDISDLPEGSYIAFVRLLSLAASTELALYVFNDTDGSYLGESTNSSTISTTNYWKWFAEPFIVDHNDSGDTFRVTVYLPASPSTTHYVDECVIIPVSNSKNFPLDARDRALRIIDMKLKGALK